MLTSDAFRLGHRSLLLSPVPVHLTLGESPDRSKGPARGHEGTAEDRFSDSYNTKGSRHKEAYVRLAALPAAIVRIVQSLNIAQTEIGSFLTGARKKSLKGIPCVIG